MYGREVSGEFAFVAHEKVERQLKSNLALPGDVVFTQRGTLGQVGLVPLGNHSRYVISQSQMRLRVAEGVADPRFVYYACSTPAFRQQVFENAIATGVPHINLGILNRLRVPHPPLAEQLVIAELLGSIDDKIEANKRRAHVADSLVTALYEKSVRGPDTRDYPLLQAVEVTFGEPFAGAAFTIPGMGRPLIRIRDLKTYEPQVWTTETRESEVLIGSGDIVVGMDAEFRATPWLGTPGLLNQRVCRVRGRSCGPAYTREALRAPLAEIEGYKSATTVIHLNKGDLARATVRVAERSALAAFEAQAEPIFHNRVESAREDRVLAQLRDALLPELMSGRLRVKDAERAVEEVL